MGEDDVDIVMSRREARILIVCSLLSAPAFIAFMLVFGVVLDTDTLPVAFFPAFIAMFVLGVVMEPVRMRIRERSGLRTWFPRQREDLRMMRSAAATSGWPPRVVEGLLLAAFLLCAAVFLRTMLPVFLEDWSSSG